MTLVGGTGTAATLTVASVKARLASAQSTGTAYTTADTITFSGGNWVTPTILTVTASAGAITGLAVTQAGVYVGALPANPITPTSTSGTGHGATVNIGWGVNAVTNTTIGSYSVLPSGALATTTNSATGVGATVTVATYQLIAPTITAGGADYQALTVAFSGSGAGTAVITAGALTAINITTPGSYTSIPTLTLTPTGTSTTDYASNLTAHLVKTFQDVTYQWFLQPTVIGPGQANIQSS